MLIGEVAPSRVAESDFGGSGRGRSLRYLASVTNHLND